MLLARGNHQNFTILTRLSQDGSVESRGCSGVVLVASTGKGSAYSKRRFAEICKVIEEISFKYFDDIDGKVKEL